MRYSQLFGKTLRQEPAEAETVSHRLLLKAGMIHPLAAGVYSYLPLGWRVLRKIERVIREEMDSAGAQEIMMPALQPIEIWQETGRDQAFGQNLFTLKDRRDRILCLGPTHEEVVTDLVRRNVKSYRDLPVILYQIQTKFRDEARPRGGLLRVREFDMKDAYSFDADDEGLERSYQAMVQAYKNIFSRCGLSPLQVEADSGAIGGKDSNEFIQLAESGEDLVLYCSNCDYAANLEKATFSRPPEAEEEARPLEKVSTPGTTTIAALSDYLRVPRERLLKAVVYWATYRKDAQTGLAEGAVLVFIAGDREVNDIKLKNLLKASELRPATDEEVKSAGILYAGFIGPSYANGAKIVTPHMVLDEGVPQGSNWVAGANEADHHLKNVNYPRDFSNSAYLADIATAREGDQCPKCARPLQQARGIEVGHVFKLGTFFTEKLGASYLDSQGSQRPIIMGCYGIGVGRLLAASVECNNDERGIVLPLSIAPFDAYLCALNMDNSRVQEEAERVYQMLQKAGLEILFDDRLETAGVKFNDADLLGIPLRVTISPRMVARGSAEVKRRSEHESQVVSLESLLPTVQALLPRA